MASLTTIEYVPIKKIIIHEIEYIDYDTFIEINAGNMVGWIDGIIYGVVHFPATPDIVAERRDGIVHWGMIQYAISEEYIPHIKTKNNLAVVVTDKSPSPPLVDAISFIKHYHQTKFKDK